MRTVLVVAAERFELRYIRDHASAMLIRVANGPGPVLAAEAVDSVRETPDLIVSAGLCGALDPAMRVGDIFVATSVNGAEVEGVTARRPCHSGPLVSMDRVAGSAEEKLALRRTGAMAVEMEAAGVLARARARRVPFCCIRVVSDVADESFALDLNAARGADGRFRLAGILGQAARRPVRVIPELVRLGRNAGRAARALGEFFGDCDF